MGKEAFRDMLRYLERCHGVAFQVLFTVEISKELTAPQRAEIMGH